MKYGLIGEKLGHSFSKEIHEMIGYYKDSGIILIDKSYRLCIFSGCEEEPTTRHLKK